MNVNGWTLKIHPAFGEKYKKLIIQVEELKEKEILKDISNIQLQSFSTILMSLFLGEYLKIRAHQNLGKVKH